MLIPSPRFFRLQKPTQSHSSLKSHPPCSPPGSSYPSAIHSGRKLSESDQEKAIVESLDYWNYNKKVDHFRRMNTARLDLEKKLMNQDIVQQFKQARKGSDPKSANPLTFKEKCKIFQQYEEECFGNYRDLKEQLSQYIENRDKLRKNIIELMEEKNKYNKELMLIGKVLKYPSRKVFSPRMKQAEIAVYLSSVRILKRKPSKNKSEIIQNIEMIDIEMKTVAREVAEVDESIEEIRKALKVTKNNILKHYLEILIEGTDTRGEGLYTIVKALLTVGVSLKDSMFPSGLDQCSIETIIKIAKKSIDQDQLREQFNLIKSTQSPNSSHQNDIGSRIAKLKKTLKTRKPDYSKKKSKWQYSHTYDIEEEPFGQTLSESVKYEAKIQELKKEIQEIQIAEIKRLTKECLKNGKNLREMICYIVGVDNIDKFMVHTNKEIKELKAAKEKTKTFTFSSKLLPERNKTAR